ncbi:MAG: four helix bundle protein [bacterium]|nr:four helix bundle protein [bacterium]
MDETEKKFRFRAFPLYKDARKLNTGLREFSLQVFPAEEKFCLTIQLWRALDSIVLNIAEGSDRGTDKDFAHFLNTAHTSLNEVVACLDISLDNSYITQEQHQAFLERCAALANQLTAFRRVLLRQPTK